MDGQRTLFGAFDTAEHSLARKSDPRTSRDAVPSDSQLSSVKRLMLDVLGEHSLTANELAELCERDPRNVTGKRCETFRKRCAELVHDGLLCVVGERQCAVTGKVAMFYGRA